MQPILTLWSRYDDGNLRKVRVIPVRDPVVVGGDAGPESGHGTSVETDFMSDKTGSLCPDKVQEGGMVLACPSGRGMDGASLLSESGAGTGVETSLTKRGKRGGVPASPGGGSLDGASLSSPVTLNTQAAVSVGTQSPQGTLPPLGTQLPQESQNIAKGKRRSKVAWRYEVEDVDGIVWIYKTAKELLAALTGHPEGRHWTFDRYFGLGKYARDNEEDEGFPSIFDILSPTNTLVKEIRLGIDLENRGDEVAKLLFARFGHIIHGCGYDPDDVLQEVYKGLLIRNKGTCQFDPRKASFGHYVNMVAECVFCNYAKKLSRRKEKEQTGAPGGGSDGDFGGSVDASESMYAERAAITVADKEGGILGQGALEDLSRFLAKRIEDGDGELALKALPLVHAGYGRTEIAEQLGVSKMAVSKALTCLRKVAREWAA